MNSVVDLATMGFVLTDDNDLMCVNAVTCAGAIIEDDAYINGSVTASEDINVGGSITSEEDNTLYLCGKLTDIGTVHNRVYFITPYQGCISKIQTVCWAAVGASGGTVRVIIDGTDMATLDVTIADAAAEGEVDSAQSLNRSYARFSVGSQIIVNTQDAVANNVAAGFVLTVHRTQE